MGLKHDTFSANAFFYFVKCNIIYAELSWTMLRAPVLPGAERAPSGAVPLSSFPAVVERRKDRVPCVPAASQGRNGRV